MYTRYAVYFTPEGALADLGASWLGWDIAKARRVAHPALSGLDVAALTDAPRKYGFHGTIKPPFVLAEGNTYDQLTTRLGELCGTLGAVRLDGLKLVALGRFLALIPTGDQHPLSTLAAAVVEQLDPFRAPPTDGELARRRQAKLTPAQDRNLIRWGYPHVMDQFRFHLTLTSRLPKAQVAPSLEAILPLFAPHFGPLNINSLTLTGQRSDGMFEEIHRYALSG